MSQAGCTVGAGARSSRDWLAILLAISGGAAAHATLPLVTDEADTQDPGTLQIEAEQTTRPVLRAITTIYPSH